jgi:drug/metabolite transporter (DMT)-like permease
MKELKLITKKNMLHSIFCGTLLFGGFLFLTLALKQEGGSPGISALIIGFGVFVVPVLSFFVYRKKLSFLSVIGILFAFVGIFCFSYTGQFSFQFTLSNLYSLISSILFGVHIFVLSIVTKQSSEKLLSILQMLVVFLFFAIYVLLFEKISLPINYSVLTWLELLFLGIFGAALAFFSQSYASKYLPVNTCNIILALESLSAVVFSILLGMDKISTSYIIGAILMIIGTLIVVNEENKTL